ncbi:MAG: cysteine desulfurase family protein [Leucobacter sp.]
MHVYFDHAATYPMPGAVLEAYTEALHGVGNPAATHGHGQVARDALEDARERISRALGCDSAELILNSGGTESINLALKGLYWARRRAGSGPVLLVAEGEHHATTDAAEWLERSQGARLRLLEIDEYGVLRPETLRRAITEEGADQIALVSFLWANNEVGSVAPVSELCAIAREAGIPAHVDAVAAMPQLTIDFAASGAAALSVSAHKIGGPVGVGALVLRRDAVADELFHGGSQQRSRSGTQNMAGAVAFATALELTRDADGRILESHAGRLRTLRDYLIERVQTAVPEGILRGADPELPGARLPGNAHFTFPGCQGDSLVFLLDAAGVSASVGSACQAGVVQASHVLLSMGIPAEDAAGALRFTLGPETTEEQIDALVAVLPDAVARARVAGLS